MVALNPNLPAIVRFNSNQKLDMKVDYILSVIGLSG